MIPWRRISDQVNVIHHYSKLRGDLMNEREAGEVVHRLAESHAAQFSCGYAEALHTVLAANPTLKSAYVGELPAEARPVTLNPPTRLLKAQAGRKLAERTAYYLKFHRDCTYHQAFAAVCAEYPQWTAVYAGFPL